MLEKRIAEKIITGRNAIDGAGVKLIRVFGYGDTKDFDPFLMMDAFDATNSDDYIKGFPWHPHRGIETVTYLLDGSIEHGDNLGNKGVIRAGDCQWMTAGSGIIHQEMPMVSPRLRGLQLWVNLPKSAKMTKPKYNGIEEEKIPKVAEDNVLVKVIAGKYGDINGAFQPEHVDINYFDINIFGNSIWTYKSDKNLNQFIYIIEGSGKIGRDYIVEHSCVLLSYGDLLHVVSGQDGIRFVLLEGLPLKEAISWGGPIVMNMKKELDLAFKELDEGTFIK
ncbi:MAG: pirin family protein [Firmicutes bacterium]|nr:pirin family protein [Bacillota bacterium]